jgi:hypothetical protein
MSTAPSKPLDTLRRLPRLLGIILALLFAAQVAMAQASRPASSQDQTTPPKPNAPPPAGQSTDNKSSEDHEVKITPREAEELFHSVDEILDFDSKQTGLPIKHEVKRKLTSRDEVVKFLTKHVNDEDTKRLRRSELVLKKFGLLPHDFDLETFFVSLLREEIAGYYDPKTKTVNLLDWVPMEEQEPVMAHELTHALQDQSFGMEKWMKKGDKDLAEIRRPLKPEDIENDEIDNAREAVIEGQAQAITFQYAIAPTGRSIVDSPDLVDSMEEETLTGTSTTKVFNSAPIFIKESLTFPYSYGMDFVIKVLQKGGKEQAFAGMLRNPPHITRQIMQPETYLSGEKIEPMPVLDFKSDFKDYQKFDIGAMGEFDVAVLIEQYAGKTVSKLMYPAWRGGYYYAAKPKQAGEAQANAPLALMYVSRWSSAEKAEQFAAIYAQSLKQRYKKVDEVGGSHLPDASAEPAAKNAEPNPKQEEPGPNDLKIDDAEQKAAAVPDLLAGRHAWNTDNGAVVIEEQGNTVLVTESLDTATTRTLEKEVFSGSTPAR